MSIAVREVTLDFATAADAADWVAANVPSGLAHGPIGWQMVIHQPSSSRVRLVQGFATLAVAGDWAGTALPVLETAASLSVAVGQAEVYVAGNLPGQQGPGRVWRELESFPAGPDGGDGGDGAGDQL